MKHCALFFLVISSSYAYPMNSFGLIPMDLGSDCEQESNEESRFGLLMQACFQNNEVKAIELCKNDWLSDEVEETPWGTNPLNWAAFHGNASLAELLLKNGFVLTVEKDGMSAVHIAAMQNKPAVLKLLLSMPSSAIDSRKSVDKLVNEHFATLTNILRTPAMSFGIQLTPCQLVPGPASATVCKEILKLETLRERLEPSVIAYCSRILIAATLP